MTDVASPPRLIEFDGANNFRDLGGYPSKFGGRTRWGVLYRAGALHGMTPADLQKFADLGVRQVYDLRGDAERDRLPDPMPSIHVPVISKLMDRGPRPHFDGLTTSDDGFAFMRDVNLALLNHCGVEFGQMIASFADPDTVPVVFHCTAGKDRTGVVAALTLEALGVDREVVLDDFELTGRYHHVDEASAAFQSMLAHGAAPEVATGALGAPRAMMGDVLDQLDERFGGIEAYLAAEAGLDATTLDRLRTTLLA